MSNPKVSIIMLNWNGWQDTIECLESLYQITYPNYDVIVVDNGSEDDSIVRIKEYAEGKIKVESKFFEYSSENKPIRIIDYTREEAEGGGGKEKEIANLPSNRKLIIIKNEKNYGFAEGNNIAMRYALKALNPDYILLLNNDTVVDKLFLGKLVEVAESDEKIGAVQARIMNAQSPSEIDSIGQDIYSTGMIKNIVIPQEGRDIKQGEVFGVCAGAALYSTLALDKAGLFDESFFIIHEDTDLSFRLRLHGFIAYSANAAIVYHKRSKSLSKVSKLSSYYGTRNALFIVLKYYPLHTICKYLPVLIYRTMLVLISPIFLKTEFNGYSFWRELKRCLKERKKIYSNHSSSLSIIMREWMLKESFFNLMLKLIR